MLALLQLSDLKKMPTSVYSLNYSDNLQQAEELLLAICGVVSSIAFLLVEASSSGSGI